MYGDWLDRKRSEKPYRFQQTNCAHCDGLSRGDWLVNGERYGGLSFGTSPDPLILLLPNIGGRVAKAKRHIGS